jgi:glycosyltransferase involved in cell wall biosynthesis
VYLHKFNLNWSGGSASILKALCDAFIALGHRVDVVSRHQPDRFGLTTCQLPFDVDLTFGPEKRPGETALDELSIKRLKQLAQAAVETVARDLFDRSLPDLVVANHINLMALAAWSLKERFGVPYRIISHGTDTQLLLKDRRYQDTFGAAARGADRVFAISGFVAKEIAQTVGGNVEILGGAVDPELFYPEKAVPAIARIVYFGRLVSEKGLWTLLRAFEQQRSATELTIVGEGPLRGELEAYVRAKRLDGVRFLGLKSPEELREIVANSALAVVPSTWEEPLGLAAVEALACGVPVIASAVGGIPEIVGHGQNGYLVPPGDAVVLATAIDRILGDPALRVELCRGARETHIPSYLDLARKVLGTVVAPAR